MADNVFYDQRGRGYNLLELIESITSGGGAVSSVAGRTGDVVLTKGDVGLGNADNTADTAKPVSTAQQTALDLKAPLASPALTGNPTAPTPPAGDNDTSIITSAFAADAIAAPWTALGSLGAAETITGVTGKTVRAAGTLDANTAITISMNAGEMIELLLVQDATGNRVPTWVTSTTWLTRSGVAPHLGFIAAAGTARFRFFKIGSTLYGEWVDEPMAGRELDYRERTTLYTITATAVGSGGIIPELVTPSIIGRGYPVLVEMILPITKNSTADNFVVAWLEVSINGGAFALAQLTAQSSPSASSGRTVYAAVRKTLAAGSTYVFQGGTFKQSGGDTATTEGNAAYPLSLAVTER